MQVIRIKSLAVVAVIVLAFFMLGCNIGKMPSVSDVSVQEKVEEGALGNSAGDNGGVDIEDHGGDIEGAAPGDDEFIEDEEISGSGQAGEDDLNLEDVAGAVEDSDAQEALNQTENVQDNNDSGQELSDVFVVKILEGVYFEPSEPHVKVGQEVVFINQPVEGKKDKAYTLVGDSKDFFASDVMQAYDQYSHVYNSPGEYTLKVSPGGAVKIFVEE